MSPARSSSKKIDASIIAIVVAFIGLVGTLVTAYFNFLGTSKPIEISIGATQTAEARATGQAQPIYDATVMAKLLPTALAQAVSTTQAQLQVSEQTPNANLAVNRIPLRFSVQADPDKFFSSDSTISFEEQQRLQNELAGQLLLFQNEKVALVVTTAHTEFISLGVALAKKLNEIIKTSHPSMFSGAIFQAYWYEPVGAVNTVDFSIYFFLP